MGESKPEDPKSRVLETETNLGIGTSLPPYNEMNYKSSQPKRPLLTGNGFGKVDKKGTLGFRDSRGGEASPLNIRLFPARYPHASELKAVEFSRRH